MGEKDARKGGTGNNSKQRADGGHTYEPVAKPNSVPEAIEALNMWGYYMRVWGKGVDAELHKQAKHTHAGGKPSESHGHDHGTGRGATHLDPPPEPFLGLPQ